MKYPSPIYNRIPVRWHTSDDTIAYTDALEYMESQVASIADGKTCEQVWALEHPALYTAGTSAKPSDLIDPDRFPVFQAKRGGQYTYHGPGQRVVYFMLDLKNRGRDVRCFVNALEGLVIDTLSDFDILSERKQGRVGVWVNMPDGSECKIAALGVRIRKWVSFHGISINVNPDLSHFSGIVPCGIPQHGVTSLHALGKPISMMELDTTLMRQFETRFGPITS